MRSVATKAEAAFLSLLRGGARGFEVRPQWPIHRFRVDFLFHRELDGRRGVVEIDGPHHVAQRSEDAQRDAFLASFGIPTLRFEDKEVFSDGERVRERMIVWLRQLPKLRRSEVAAFDRSYREYLLKVGFPFKDNGYHASIWVSKVSLVNDYDERAEAYRVYMRNCPPRSCRSVVGSFERAAANRAYARLVREIDDNKSVWNRNRVRRRYEKLTGEELVSIRKSVRP